MQILTLPQVIGCYMNCCVSVLMTIYLLSVSILLETNITLCVDVTCSRVFPITLRLNLTRLGLREKKREKVRLVIFGTTF